MLSEEADDHEKLTAPLLVIASVSKKEFKDELVDKYTYQVIGGVQRFTAIAKINESGEGREIISRKCVVYGCDLSRRASLILAKQHNEYNQIQRSTTFAEIASSCRRLLFSHFAPEGQKDDGSFMPVIPRYNSQKYRDWKVECTAFLVSSQVVCAHMTHAQGT